ncbi:MAG: hypothetical protein IJA50_00275 [Firmicutes bacterium]|nr:hypothetical protein [Bacillota bacterium]
MDIFYSGKKKIAAAAILTLVCCILMVAFPSTVLRSARKAIDLWMLDVLPALLPFFICSGFLQNLGVMRYLGSGIFPFAMSALSGYPMGASIIGSLRRSGDVSLDEAKKMLSYCSTSGPAFMIGAVGAGMMGSGQIGMIIAVSHYAGALINGFVHGGISLKRREKTRTVRYAHDEGGSRIIQNSLYDALTDSILMSLKSVGIILAYIVMFMFITDIITVSGVTNSIDKPWAEALLKGLVEMTVGCEAAAGCIGISKTVECVICTFMISWGGLSVIGQTMSMLAGTGITVGYVVAMKFTHGLFSAAAAFTIALFML